MSVQFLAFGLLATLLLTPSAVVRAHDMGNELGWLLPEASVRPRLIKDERLPAGDVERRLMTAGQAERLREDHLFGTQPGAGDADQQLIEAARAGRVKALKEALGEGARANVEDLSGNRPLHAAVANGHREIVRLLLKAGADPNAGNRLGHAALDIAVLHRQAQMLDLLLKHDADLERRNGIGNTPLITALLMERDDMAREMVQRGARLDARSGDKRCIGELAAAHASEALLNLILEQGGSAACR